MPAATEPLPAAPAADTPAAGAAAPSTPTAVPAGEPAPVTPDLARALFPGGQAETAGTGEAPPVADLYAQLFPSGAPPTAGEPAVAAEATVAPDDTSLALGPFRVRAGVDARYVDADTFVDDSASTTRDRYLEVAPRVEAEAPVGPGASRSSTTRGCGPSRRTTRSTAAPTSRASASTCRSAAT